MNLANGSDGIRLDDDSQNFAIGGVGPGQANIIAYNHGNGVTVTGNNSFGDSIRGNAIFANSGLGIDLGNDGVTPNHVGGLAAGPNGFENFPVLTQAVVGSSTQIAGTIQSAAEESLTIDFYSNPAADPSGHGQGRVYLGSTVVTTDGFGNAAFNLTLAAATSVGSVISATATDASGNTSEFSADLAEVQSTTTTLAESAATSTYGNSVTFTAAVSPQISGVPTGTETFYLVDSGNHVISTLGTAAR